MEGTLEEIRSFWEVPTIAHFCSLFREAFKLSDFDIEELEDALLIDGTDYGTILIQQLVINLLNGCLQKNVTDENNYDGHLMDYITRKHALEGKHLEFPANTTFKQLPIRTKVEILHSLCNYRLDGYDVTDLLKNLESDSLRVEPLGKDESGATYWYFYGTRLYKEVPRNKLVELQKKQKKKVKKFAENLKVKRSTHRNHRKIKKVKKFTYSSESESDRDAENLGPITGWSIVCSTEEDWHALAKKFKNSKSRTEKELYNSISKDFLPEIGRIALEKEKNLKRRLLEMAPRRVSRRIEVKKQEQDVSVGEKSSDNQLELEQSTDNSRPRRSYSKRPLEDTESIYTKKSREERALDRIKAKHARARRAQQRNEKLQSIDDDMSNSHRAVSCILTQEELYAGMYKVIEAMKDHPNSWPFLRPVKEEMVPGYYKIIKNPMDISIIEGKLNGKKYFTRLDFEADIMLMLDNCREFNGLKSRFTRMGESLRKVYKDNAEEVFMLDNDADDTYDPSPTKRPARSKAAASLKNTMSAVHKNTAILGLNGRASMQSQKRVLTSIRKSTMACHTISSIDITTTVKPTLSNFYSHRVMPAASFSTATSNGESVPGTNVLVKYSVPSTEDFARLNPMQEATKVSTSLLIKKEPAKQTRVVKLSPVGFHRLPFNIDTSVRSKLAQAKPVQLDLSAASLSQVTNGTLPNGARTVILKPGAYFINSKMGSILKTGDAPSSQGRTMVVVCAPKKQGPSLSSIVGDRHIVPTVTKRAYSILNDSERIHVANGSCHAKLEDNSIIPSKRFAVAPHALQINSGVSHSPEQPTIENGAPFSKSMTVPAILRTSSTPKLRKDNQIDQTQDATSSIPMISNEQRVVPASKHFMGLAMQQ